MNAVDVGWAYYCSTICDWNWPDAAPECFPADAAGVV